MKWTQFVSAAARTCLVLAASACAPHGVKESAGAPYAAKTESFDRSGIVLVSTGKSSLRHPSKDIPHDDPEIRSLLPFLSALSDLQAGTRKDPVTVLQIGDSHTAGDFLSGRMRELLQERFGAAGRGFLPPGFPDKYYKPDLIQVTESKSWQRLRSMNPDSTEHFGIGGVLQRAAEPHQQMSITSTEAAGFDHGFVEVIGPAKFSLTVDNASAREFNVPGGTPNGDWLEFDTPAGSHQLNLQTEDGSPVTLLSWGTQRKTPGILYSNLGTIGAMTKLIGHWDPEIVHSELQHLDPALILIAFGTNEAFGNSNDLTDFRRDFSDYVSLIARDAPNAAIVIIGPPDVNRRYRRPYGVSGDCTTRPLTESAPATTAAPPKKGRAPRGMIWATPPELVTVRTEEKSVAAEHGWYFWDWSAAMGGACAAHRWSVRAEPFSGQDHVHQTIAGYRFSAEHLYADLMTTYDRYRSENNKTAVRNKTAR